jgi:shikimate dehydrogenase
MRKFGLIGKNISYSFSRGYFNNKFESESIENVSYQNFDLDSLKEFRSIFKDHPEISGLNVTIPYKEKIIEYLDSLSKTAKKIGAVNTIKITKKGKLKGYNTDYYGFKRSLEGLIQNQHKKALILGTGGASKAVAFTLEKLNISYNYVSRTKSSDNLTYNELDDSIIKENLVIINCSPLGTHPNINDCPNIPYDSITKNHILFDLIYNPEETLFLKYGKQKGCIISNGLKMLEFQAEKSWAIWNR